MPPSQCTQCGVQLRAGNVKRGTTMCYSCYSRLNPTRPTDYVAVKPQPAVQPVYEPPAVYEQPQAPQTVYAPPQATTHTTYQQPAAAYGPPVYEQPQPTTQITQTIITPGYQPDRKSPVVAAILSLLIVGLGHFYIGKWWRGLAFLIAAPVVLLLTIWMLGLGVIIVWIIATIDAYMQAKARNRRAGYPE